MISLNKYGMQKHLSILHMLFYTELIKDSLVLYFTLPLPIWTSFKWLSSSFLKFTAKLLYLFQFSPGCQLCFSFMPIYQVISVPSKLSAFLIVYVFTCLFLAYSKMILTQFNRLDANFYDHFGCSEAIKKLSIFSLKNINVLFRFFCFIKFLQNVWPV